MWDEHVRTRKEKIRDLAMAVSLGTNANAKAWRDFFEEKKENRAVAVKRYSDLHPEKVRRKFKKRKKRWPT